MKFINTKTNFAVLEFKEGNAIIHDRFLEAALQTEGISIPPGCKGFEGKEVIHLDDPLFEKAFVEVYCPLTIANPAYKWQS